MRFTFQRINFVPKVDEKTGRLIYFRNLQFSRMLTREQINRNTIKVPRSSSFREIYSPNRVRTSSPLNNDIAP